MQRLAILLVVCCCIGLVYSWGMDGHQIVAQVASAFVTPTTQTSLNKMLNGQTLASISTWPDSYDQTSQGAWSGHLHYANIPDDRRNFTLADCVPPYLDDIGCVVTAIYNFTLRMEDDFHNNQWQACVSNGQQPCDLSFVVHFVGDMHQPLHVSRID